MSTVETKPRQDLTPTDEKAPNRLTAIRVKDDGPMSYLLDTDRFEHAQRIASIMAKSNLLPKHLRGNGPTPEERAQQSMANCFRVVNQAFRWGFDPFAIVDETYEVHGRMGYQGKLIAAVVNAKCSIAGGLRYVYNTQQADHFAVVTFASEFPITPEQFDWLVEYAESEDRLALQELTKARIMAVRVSVGQARTTNDMWNKDPEQKLAYNGALKWARRYAPQLMLGVLTDDDVDRMTAGQLPAEGGPLNLDGLTQALRGAAIDTTASEPKPTQADQAKAEAAGVPMTDAQAEQTDRDNRDHEEPEAKQQKPAPGVVVTEKEPEGEPAGEGFALAAQEQRPEVAAMIKRIGKLQSAGAVKRVLAEVMPSGLWSDAEKAEIKKAAEYRDKVGYQKGE
jgi:hypothetical protein